MDLVTVATLAFFGSLFAGALIGFLIGRFTAFELGLGVGLLIPGIVALSFATRCLSDYRAFTSPQATKAIGEVIAIEDRPVGSGGKVTQPVPVVRFRLGDSVVHVRGPASGGFKTGDRVTVLYDPTDLFHARIADASNLRGGAIAFMLFGTFPLSLGLWFIHSHAAGRAAARRRAASEESPGRAADTLAVRMRRELLVGLNMLLVAAILYPAFGPGEIERRLTVGFGLVALALFGHGIRGAFDPRVNASWCFGMFVLAVNFSAWATALWLLS